MLNQYEPWVSEGITECEYFKKRYLEARQELGEQEKVLRSQLAEALANEQSSAKAYAERLAREAQMIIRIQELTNDLGQCESARESLLFELSSVEFTLKALKDSDSSTRRTLIEFALARIADSSPAPDLVGVIKTLTAALNEIDDLWLDHKMPAFIAERVLASTSEIRERIGAV